LRVQLVWDSEACARDTGIVARDTGIVVWDARNVIRVSQRITAARKRGGPTQHRARRVDK
jgi:hypothetical protein